MAFRNATFTQDGSTQNFAVVNAADATDAVEEGSAPGDVDLSDYAWTDRAGRTCELEFTTPTLDPTETITEFLFNLMVKGTESDGDLVGATASLVVSDVVWSVKTYKYGYDPAEERGVVFDGFTKTGADWNGKTKKIRIESVNAAGGGHDWPPDPHIKEQ